MVKHPNNRAERRKLRKIKSVKEKEAARSARATRKLQREREREWEFTDALRQLRKEGEGA